MWCLLGSVWPRLRVVVLCRGAKRVGARDTRHHRNSARCVQTPPYCTTIAHYPGQTRLQCTHCEGVRCSFTPARFIFMCSRLLTMDTKHFHRNPCPHLDLSSKEQGKTHCEDMRKTPQDETDSKEKPSPSGCERIMSII